MQVQKRHFGLVIAILALFAIFFAQSVSMAQSPTATTQVELVGVIEAMTLDTITVNQQVIDVSSAEIKVALEIGIAVKVEGTIDATGQIIAQQVTSPDDTQGGMLPGEVEIVGLLTAYEGTTMTIGGQTFDVSTAEIKAGVAVGEIVKVHAVPSDTGVWMAREVEVAALGTPDNTNANDNNSNANDNNSNANDNQNTTDFEGGEIELTGTLTEVNSDSIVVAGQTINTATAEIKDTLVVGALVKVHLSVVNGELVAREVELVGQPGQNGEDNGAVVIPADCVPAQPAGWTTYTIQAGDTLSSIAERSNGSVGEIALANCITDPRFIVAGMSIYVPQQPVAEDNLNSNDNQGQNNLNNNDNHSGEDNNSNANDNHSEDNHNSNDNQDDHGGSNSGGGSDDGSGHS